MSTTPPLPRIARWTHPRDALRLLLSGATASTCLPFVLVVKVLATYAIPFLTSSTGALLAVRERSGRHG